MSNVADWRSKIQDYYAGRLAPEEQAALLEWMERLTPAQLEEYFPAAEGKKVAPYPMTAMQLEAALQKVKERSVKRPARIITLLNNRRKVYWQAACVTALLGIGAWLANRQLRGEKARSVEVASVHYRTIKVEDGSRSQVRLPDGTMVVLNGGSVLEVPDQFAGSSREVYLREGEALLDVAKDATKPFILHSHDMDVRVLGTSFSIRDYVDERNAEAGVRSGKIAVSRSGGSEGIEAVNLIAGDRVVLNKEQSVFSKQSCDTADVAAWVRGELIFRNATLHHVLNVLKHRYAVGFDVQRRDIEDEKYTATFRNYNLETIMLQLQLMSGLQYTFQGKTILIR